MNLSTPAISRNSNASAVMSCAGLSRRPFGGGVLRSRSGAAWPTPRSCATDAAKNAGSGGCGRDAVPVDGGLRLRRDAAAHALGPHFVQTRGAFSGAGGQLEFHLRQLCADESGGTDAEGPESLCLYGRGDARGPGCGSRYDPRGFGQTGRDLGAGEYGAERLGGVRWIVEDALKFVQREVRRGNRYNGIILDPPAYGRGANGEKWILEDNIGEMLECCARLLEPCGAFLVLNLYSMGLSATLASTAVRAFGTPFEEQFGELCFDDRAGKRLPLGTYCRFAR